MKLYISLNKEIIQSYEYNPNKNICFGCFWNKEIFENQDRNNWAFHKFRFVKRKNQNNVFRLWAGSNLSRVVSAMDTGWLCKEDLEFNKVKKILKKSFDLKVKDSCFILSNESYFKLQLMCSNNLLVLE